MIAATAATPAIANELPKELAELPWKGTIGEPVGRAPTTLVAEISKRLYSVMNVKPT